MSRPESLLLQEVAVPYDSAHRSAYSVCVKVASPADADLGLDLTRVVPSCVPSAALVTEVDLDPLTTLPGGWESGPLPIVQAVNATTAQRGHRPTTDEPARRTLVASPLADALYGSGKPIRFHRLVRRSVLDASPILALELLCGPPEVDGSSTSTGWLAVHMAVPGAGWRDQSAIHAHLAMTSALVHEGARAGCALWQSIEVLLPDRVKLRAGARIRTVSFQPLGVQDGRDISQTPAAAAYLLIASASPDHVADLSRRALRHSLTIERRDWSALVLRDGAAFVAHQQSNEAFTDVLRVLTHSVHLDAMFLALMQRRLVDASGARAVIASIDDPDELVRLERWHFDFKRNYWRTSLTHKRSSPSDEVLRACQAELLTSLDVAEVEERVQDGVQLARSLQAERQNHGQQQLNRMVQNASIIIGALGVSFTAAPVVADPSWGLFAVAGVVGLLAMAIAFCVLHLTGRRAGLS
jgi:hypothetical protein